MRQAWRNVAIAFSLFGVLFTPLAPVTAQQTGPGVLPLSDRADGARLDDVKVSIRRSGGNFARDSAIEASVSASLSGLAGRSFSRLELERRLSATRMGWGLVVFRGVCLSRALAKVWSFWSKLTQRLAMASLTRQPAY